MAASEHLEIEREYDVGEEAEVSDLSGLPGVSSVSGPPHRTCLRCPPLSQTHLLPSCGSQAASFLRPFSRFGEFRRASRASCRVLLSRSLRAGGLVRTLPAAARKESRRGGPQPGWLHNGLPNCARWRRATFVRSKPGAGCAQRPEDLPSEPDLGRLRQRAAGTERRRRRPSAGLPRSRSLHGGSSARAAM